MDVELAALVSAGATTLVGLLATDAWERIKAGISLLWGRAGPDDVQIIEAELVRSRHEVLAAAAIEDVTAVEDLAAAWRVKFRRLLEDHPEAADELRRILEWERDGGSTASGISQNAVADRGSTVWQAGRDIHTRNESAQPPRQ